MQTTTILTYAYDIIKLIIQQKNENSAKNDDFRTRRVMKSPLLCCTGQQKIKLNVHTSCWSTKTHSAIPECTVIVCDENDNKKDDVTHKND